MKTIKIPISEEITKRKKYIINRISERMTYAVQCPICGSKEVKIEDREFRCNSSVYEGDRDVVGSINIMLKGITMGHVSEKTRMVGAGVTQPEVWMMGLKKFLNTQPLIKAF
ncbi:MAG: zinc ribbon domain-containing protein [Thermoplasmata archaeon]